MKSVKEALRRVADHLNTEKLNLLKAELRSIDTFVSMACDARNEASRFRIQANARKAYDNALEYAPEIIFSDNELRKANDEFARLKQGLSELGETGLG